MLIIPSIGEDTKQLELSHTAGSGGTQYGPAYLQTERLFLITLRYTYQLTQQPNSRITLDKLSRVMYLR